MINGRAHLRSKPRIASPQLPLAIITDDAGTWPGDHVCYLSRFNTAADGFLPDGCRAVMFRMGLEPRKKREKAQLVAVERHHLRDRGPAGRQRSRLVEGEG